MMSTTKNNGVQRKDHVSTLQSSVLASSSQPVIVQDKTSSSAAITDTGTTKKTSSSFSFGTSNFPAKLYFMLNEMEKDGQNDIASWNTNGRSFIVYKPKKFEKEILPIYFQQTKYESFQRQLNLYNFCRIKVGKDKGTCYHEHFIRGQEQMVYGIRRTKVKDRSNRNSQRTASHLPDFSSAASSTSGIGANADTSLFGRNQSGAVTSDLQSVVSRVHNVIDIPKDPFDNRYWEQEQQHQSQDQVLLDSFSDRWNLSAVLNQPFAQNSSGCLLLPTMPLLINNQTNLRGAMLSLNILQAELSLQRSNHC